MQNNWLETVDLCRYYRRGTHEVRAVDRVNFHVKKGEFVAVVGSSGSGKSTLLSLLAGLDTPTSGCVEVDGTSLESLSRRELAAYRAHRVGMVFQSFNLIAHHTALRNVELALYFNDTPAKERRIRSTEILEKLGLGDRLDHRPADLSGGEQQRVALARALVKNPEILFADEPTGNLDLENTRQIANLISDLNKQGLTIVMATHDIDMAQKVVHRTVRMTYGKMSPTDELSNDGGEKQ
ncbi:MAG: ABC transporter ATP-binding protein [Candidatus Zixiibacteriota bacterium]